MKDELKAMEAHLKELKALKKYDEVKSLSQEVSQLKADSQSFGLRGISSRRKSF